MNKTQTPIASAVRQFHTKGSGGGGDDDIDDAVLRREITRIGSEFSSFATARKARETEHDARLLALEQRSARSGGGGGGAGDGFGGGTTLGTAAEPLMRALKDTNSELLPVSRTPC